MMKYATFLFVLMLTSDSAYSQESDRPPDNFVEDVTNAGTSAAAFLRIGVGSRAQSMGNAAAGQSENATALFWNPASAVLMDGDVNIAFDHTNWLINTSLDYVGIVFNFPGIGALGLSILSFQAIDEQPVRTILEPEGTGEFYSASDLALGVTYAAQLTGRFSAGITGKYIRQALWNETASSGAFDLGIIYNTRLEGLSLAASISNFGGDLQLTGRDLRRPYDDDPGNFSNDQLNTSLDTDLFSLPLTFRFGFGYERRFADIHQFTMAVDLLNPSDNSESVNVGIEYTFMDTISLRSGLIALFEKDRTGGSTFGVGVSRKLLGGLGLSASYSYANWGILDATHRITISISR
jgi:Type IX secretion system protein PorV